MKWIGRRQSDNVDDRRGMSGGGRAVLGGGVLGNIILLVKTFVVEKAQILNQKIDQINQQQ